MNIQSIATIPGNLCSQTIIVFLFISMNIETVRRAILLLKLLIWLNIFMQEILIVYLCVSHSFRHCCHSNKQDRFDSCLQGGKQDLDHV